MGGVKDIVCMYQKCVGTPVLKLCQCLTFCFSIPINKCPLLSLYINPLSLLLKQSYAEGKGRQRRKLSKTEQTAVYITLHCFSLTGENQELMLPITDLVLFPMVMDSDTIGVKLQSCDS